MIVFDNDFIYKYDVKTIKGTEQENKVSPTEKLTFCNSVPLCNISSMRFGHQFGTWNAKT